MVEEACGSSRRVTIRSISPLHWTIGGRHKRPVSSAFSATNLSESLENFRFLRSLSSSSRIGCRLFSGSGNLHMEGGKVAEKQQTSYTYWVRDMQEDAAPLPVPRKLTTADITKQAQSSPLGSVWNQAFVDKDAGTWEEKNLNTWASNRIKELLKCLDSLEFSNGKAYIEDVSKCSGDAFLVTVRNKKRVGYTYELTLKFKGEWQIQNELKKIKGHLDIPEFSFGEVEDLEFSDDDDTLTRLLLQMEVTLSEEQDLEAVDKSQICKDMRSFLTPIREKLHEFEQELKDR
ncbi:hypothetical protein ZIOFF_010468 [Zingiber officinale]|uniref:Activator of Hsp90 ATPase AHSA1-like N-terminal domain-containing protein n=1 Tax=Zingiber officinale TaxID=94328 RepID=A0A8J5HP51_ZINOF|nr:hypothetical protein ZIOFF_010468 [Zingiber officinale]